MFLRAIFRILSTVYQTVPKALFRFSFPFSIFIDDFSFSDFIVSNGMMSGEHPGTKICKGTVFP